MVRKKYFAAAIAVAVILWMALALISGPLNAFDSATIDALAAQRLVHPFLTHAGIWISFAGGAPVTLILALVAAAYLVWRGRLFGAAALLTIVVSGRVLVDLLKLWFARPRPDLELQAVTVQSLSFPSGHAANSMTAFVAAALFCVPETHRKPALAAAVAASLLVGLSRPLLGVHWPSDVVAGWIFGLLWAIGWWQIACRFDPAKIA